MIPPGSSGEFVAGMEQVLDVYRQPYDRLHPVVCMDESPRQLIRETRAALPARPGRTARFDYEYERCGVASVFLAVEPLSGQRMVRVTQQRTRIDWAHFIRDIARFWGRAEKITLVMDNLNTHTPGSLYQVFKPVAAKRLWDRFRFIYTPKHGSWLNMAEIELNVLTRQCLDRRIDNLPEMQREVATWQNLRNNANSKIDWQFTTGDARIKLKRLYPTLQL